MEAPSRTPDPIEPPPGGAGPLSGNGAPDDDGDELPRVERPLLIRGTIILTILFVLAMTALIWSRWYPVSLPSSELIFIGDASVRGAVASVLRDGKTIGSVTLEKENNYIGEVWLVPGQYELQVSLEGHVIQQSPVTVRHMQRVKDTLSLKPFSSQTLPSTVPWTPPS